MWCFSSYQQSQYRAALVGMILATLTEHAAEDKMQTGLKKYMQKQLRLCFNTWSSSSSDGLQGELENNFFIFPFTSYLIVVGSSGGHEVNTAECAPCRAQRPEPVGHC